MILGEWKHKEKLQIVKYLVDNLTVSHHGDSNGGQYLHISYTWLQLLHSIVRYKNILYFTSMPVDY